MEPLNCRGPPPLGSGPLPDDPPEGAPRPWGVLWWRATPPGKWSPLIAGAPPSLGEWPVAGPPPEGTPYLLGPPPPGGCSGDRPPPGEVEPLNCRGSPPPGGAATDHPPYHYCVCILFCMFTCILSVCICFCLFLLSPGHLPAVGHDTDRQTDRQTGRQTDRHRHRHKHRHGTHRHRHMHTHTHTHTHTHRHAHTGTQTDAHTDTRAHRHAHAQTHRHRHRRTDTHTHSHPHTQTRTPTPTHTPYRTHKDRDIEQTYLAEVIHGGTIHSSNRTLRCLPSVLPLKCPGLGGGGADILLAGTWGWLADGGQQRAQRKRAVLRNSSGKNELWRQYLYLISQKSHRTAHAQ